LILSYICPGNPQLATTWAKACRRGLGRSVDGGVSWQPVGPATLQAGNVVAQPGSGFLALLSPLSAHGSGDAALYRSLDDGKTWSPAAPLPRSLFGQGSTVLSNLAAFAAVPWQPSRLLLGSGLVDLRAIVFASTDGGTTWTTLWQLATSRPSALEPLGIVVTFAALAHQHILLFSDLGAIYRSTDDGQTWTRARFVPPLRTLTEAEVWALQAAPDGGSAYAGSTDGVYHSDATASNWHLLS
jgi:hypothetical protein